MTISPMPFICLVFAEFGLFLMGAGGIWWVFFQSKAMKGDRTCLRGGMIGRPGPGGGPAREQAG